MAHRQWQLTSIRSAAWRGVVRIERKVGVTGDGEVVDSEGVQCLCRLELAGHRLCGTELGEAVRHEEDEDNEQAVCRPLDLEVAEE